MKKIYLSHAKGQIARHNTIREINKQIVLNYVRVRSPISRADIARETALQRSTVSAIIDDLERAGLIEEIGAGSSSGGRKPQMLRLKTGIPVAIGVDITPGETTVVLADLGGNFLRVETFPTSSDIEYMNEQIINKVSSFAREKTEFGLEVGLTVPGITDQEKGEILYIPYFQWSNWDIAKRITKATGLPVIIDNDANAVALAELWFGDGKIRRSHNFILIMVSEGIGTGIVIDGAVYRGENGAAGEFGHMYVGDDAPVQCSCGSRVCWEAHASENAIISRYHTSSGSPASVSVGFGHLIDLAVNGEKHAIGILKETATYLGIGISNLIIGFSPETVVLSGGIVKAWEFIKDEINSHGQRSIRGKLSPVRIVPSTLGESPTILGAISLVLSKKFMSAT
jgi:predicted NBD/HSP70 family sugar kinase